MSEALMEGLLEDTWLMMLFTVLWISSSISAIFHLYKFYNSPSPKSLPAWTISFYCCFLLLIYILTPVQNDIFRTMQRAMVTAEFIKFIIVFDILLTFYNIAMYYQEPSSDTQNKKLVYYLCSTSIPLLYSLVFFILIGVRDPYFSFGDLHDASFGPFAIVKIIRFVGYGVIIGTIWYIRLASKSTNGLWKKYREHVRILVIIGGLSNMFCIAQALHDASEFKGSWKDDYAEPCCWEYFLEGLVIGLFALKKSTPGVIISQSDFPVYAIHIANAI